MVRDFDIIVVGCGLVGSTFIYAIKPLMELYKLNVAVIEKKPFILNSREEQNTHKNQSTKALALSYGTKLLYEDIGIWPEVFDYACAIKEINVIDQISFGVAKLDTQAINAEGLGYIIESFQLKRILKNKIHACQEQGLISIFSPAEVKNIQHSQSQETEITLVLDKQKLTCRSKLTIIADGGNSELLNILHITSRSYDYKQHAIITNLTVDQKHDGKAYEIFSGDTSLALLPLKFNQVSKNRFGFVWIMPSEQVDYYMKLNPDEFLHHAQQALKNKNIKFIDVDQRKTYPLTTTLANEQVRHGLVILGSTAHMFHPIAGQGYNLSVRDIKALVDNIKLSIENSSPIGHLRNLLKYKEKQDRDQFGTIQFCDKLVKVFSRKEKSITLARNFGLNFFNTTKQLKKSFIKKAMGL